MIHLLYIFHYMRYQTKWKRNYIFTSTTFGEGTWQYEIILVSTLKRHIGYFHHNLWQITTQISINIHQFAWNGFFPKDIPSLDSHVDFLHSLTFPKEHPPRNHCNYMPTHCWITIITCFKELKVKALKRHGLCQFLVPEK